MVGDGGIADGQRRDRAHRDQDPTRSAHFGGMAKKVLGGGGGAEKVWSFPVVRCPRPCMPVIYYVCVHKRARYRVVSSDGILDADTVVHVRKTFL